MIANSKPTVVDHRAAHGSTMKGHATSRSTAGLKTVIVRRASENPVPPHVAHRGSCIGQHWDGRGRKASDHEPMSSSAGAA